jgi:hypothetical protein
VLLRVAVFGGGVGDFRVVAWDPATGDLPRVSSTEQAAVDFSEGLLRAVGDVAPQ